MATKRIERDSPTSTFNRAGENEPLFILRSTDRTALAAVFAWIKDAHAVGVPMEKIEGAMALARDMMHWQRKNPQDVRTPD